MSKSWIRLLVMRKVFKFRATLRTHAAAEHTAARTQRLRSGRVGEVRRDMQTDLHV